jgi:hypothetical protein
MTVGKVKDFNFSSGGMAKGYAKGGEARVKDTIRNERQELNRVSAKQRDAGQEMSRVRSEMRYDKNELKGMAKGGAMNQGGREMLKNRGTLGVVGNKNPGETRMHTAPKLPGAKMMMNKGGMAMSKGKGKNC